MRQRKIEFGNAQDVIVRGRDVTIIPPSVERSGMTSNRFKVIRGQGLDVINGSERANPDEIPVTDSAYPGWRFMGTIAGEEIAITNNLLPGWTEAWLILNVTVTLTGFAGFDVTVTEARLENRSEYPNTYPVWKNNPGDGSMTVADGIFNYPVATTVNGRRRMVNFHQWPYWWDEYNTPRYAADRYLESISTDGLNDCGLGYYINVYAQTGSGSVQNCCYMDSVSSPYSGSDLIIIVKETY